MINLAGTLADKIKYIKHRYFDNYVFIHINKTGGSSIEKALWLPFEHKTAVEKIDEIGCHEWLNRISFSVVRNPWDKVVSHYHYRVLTDQTGMGDGHISFNEWIRKTYVLGDPRYLDNKRMFMPQVDWLCDKDGNLIVQHILRFENLTKEFNDLARRLGVKAKLPHIKKSNHSGYREYYDEESVDIIATKFLKDINMFGYKF